MNKHLFYVAILAIAAFSVLKTVNNYQSKISSNILLENVEAFADDGEPWEACGCKMNGDGCYCNKVFYAWAKEPNA